MLYQVEFTGQKLPTVLAQFWEENPVSDDIRDFTVVLVEGTLRNIKEIDGMIESSSTNWKLSRMASVDRNLLRQATFELRYLDDIPHSVTLNESVEIAKKFGTEESSSFINGILDKIAKAKKT